MAKKRKAGGRLDPLELSKYADGLLETCAKRRLSLEASMHRVLPAVAKELGAMGAFVSTRNEDLQPEIFGWGLEPTERLSKPRARRATVKDNGATWIVQPLDLAGEKIGVAGFAFEHARARRAKLPDCVDAFCEELDGILSHIHTAAVKQELVETVTRALSNRVLNEGLDKAVAALHEEIPFDDLAICFRDEINPSNYGLQYRVYKGAHCTHDAETRHHRVLRAAIEAEGIGVIDPQRNRLAEVLGLTGAVESVLISGIAHTDTIGKVAVSSDQGLNTFSRDLFRVFAGVLTQRLVDYRRERVNLARFFEAGVVSHLLRDPNYREKYLAPRVAEIAILFADINSFTKLCEHALIEPAEVGKFVDEWSDYVVDIVWKHGGVFDKMVGDCVIALFGPPFFKSPSTHRAQSAVRAALEIQQYTMGLSSHENIQRLAELAGLDGLGVGVGVNLCEVAVGHFGPNEEYTAFGTGMNETARLQSEAGFREIFVMDTVREALVADGKDKGLAFDGPRSAKVKNVPEPLRFYRVDPA